MAARGVRNEIWVNAGGRRFHDESARGGATGTAALRSQRPATCWSLFDGDEAARLTLTHPRYGSDEQPDRGAIDAFLDRSPFAHRGDSPADVARSAGLPAAELAATVAAYNDAFANGRRDAFGRDLAELRPIDRAPFVAGEIAGMAGGHINGRAALEGTMVGPSLFSGRIAGRAMARAGT
jgi:hypothetical protein